MPKRIFSAPSKPHLVNEFRFDERCHLHGVDRAG